ncbi:MAG: pyridoxamine 5'-phosphate oxidase [Chloroflexi bacterium]|nr:pyridoxamine 5'-phosphate oxidase [Chloroflexota bacterium]
MDNDKQAGRPHMPGYGIEAGAEGQLTWSYVDEGMAAARNYWVSSAGPDGKPHAAPVWGLWHAGAFYFSTGERTVKQRNLHANPEVVVHLESGDDSVILEGRVARVKNEALGKALDALYQEKYGFPIMGEHPTYALRPRKVLAWREADFPKTATRWLLDEDS